MPGSERFASGLAQRQLALNLIDRGPYLLSLLPFVCLQLLPERLQFGLPLANLFVRLRSGPVQAPESARPRRIAVCIRTGGPRCLRGQQLGASACEIERE